MSVAYFVYVQTGYNQGGNYEIITFRSLAVLRVDADCKQCISLGSRQSGYQQALISGQ
jgi:hypothetical protein